MTGPLGIVNFVSLDFVTGNVEILGKQNSLFPTGPVIKCFITSYIHITVLLLTKAATTE